MGDHRLSVEMTLVGADGKVHKREMWVNWHADQPERVLYTLEELAEEAQLPFNTPYEYTDL